MYKQENVGDGFHQEALQCAHGTDRLGASALPDVVPGEWVEWFELAALCESIETPDSA